MIVHFSERMYKRIGGLHDSYGPSPPVCLRGGDLAAVTLHEDMVTCKWCLRWLRNNRTEGDDRL